MTKEKWGEARWKMVQCLQCEKAWSTDLERPDTCPHCGSPVWDAPKQVRRRPKKTNN